MGARCGQRDEDKIGGNRRIGVHDRSCRGLATAGTGSAEAAPGPESSESTRRFAALAGQAAEPGNALTRTESRIGEVGRGMYTRQRTRQVGRDTDCAEGRALAPHHPRRMAAARPKGLTAVSPVCRSGGRPGWRDRRTAEAAIYIPRSNPRVSLGELAAVTEGEGRSRLKTEVSSDPYGLGWREAPAAKPLGAWHA